jgi:hypothetical protein
MGFPLRVVQANTSGGFSLNPVMAAHWVRAVLGLNVEAFEFRSGSQSARPSFWSRAQIRPCRVKKGSPLAVRQNQGRGLLRGSEILPQAVNGRSEVPIFQSQFRKISNFVGPEKSQVRTTVFTGFGGRMRVRGFAGTGIVATARRHHGWFAPS